NFLSPHTNKRTDEYGGSFENRARLLLEVVADIRSKVPRDFPLSVRLSVSDYEPEGFPVEETVELARLLERAGVDVIHASGGHHAQMHYETSPWYMPRALHREGWTKIKRAAALLADRGHKVTLFEPKALGGRLVPATRWHLKRDLAGLLSHLIHQVQCRPISVVQELATVEKLRDFDAVMVATGAVPRKLE